MRPHKIFVLIYHSRSEECKVGIFSGESGSVLLSYISVFDVTMLLWFFVTFELSDLNRHPKLVIELLHMCNDVYLLCSTDT